MAGVPTAVLWPDKIPEFYIEEFMAQETNWLDNHLKSSFEQGILLLE